ncbi:MAG: GspE/PulE family protein [Planctomyces sp.]|jgi:general secretion pathway protein E|nr:GspE/PulE family protein [Planctomyces sp.]
MRPEELQESFAAALAARRLAGELSVPETVQMMLLQAAHQRVSDIHLTPEETILRMQWRIDGVLQTAAGFDREFGSRLVARLKVIAGLLTYRTDVPQEGRVAAEFSESEIRVSTFPTLYGEKAAVRLFGGNSERQMLEQLGLPAESERCLWQQLLATSGVLLITGPSSSGKTTTAYALIREILRQSAGARCVMTMEDPIESAIAGAAQSQVRPAAGFDLAAGLKSMMRQDPDVIMVGEIRDPATAEATFQAALTGHLVIATFHAGSAVEALTRLLEMGLEPYLVRSALNLVVSQRLLRRSCDCRHSREGISPARQVSPDKSLSTEGLSFGCNRCGGTGYLGRMALAECLDPSFPLVARSLLARSDSQALFAAAEQSGLVSLKELGERAIRAGETTREEFLRVFGGRLVLSDSRT